MRRITVLLFSLFICSEQVCFPDEDLSDCVERKKNLTAEADEDRLDISERSSLISGRYCFATPGGYFGQCEFRGKCPRRHSRSRTCGGNHVCCKTSTNNLDSRRTTRSPWRVRTTTTTSQPTVSRSEGATCGVMVTDLIYCRGSERNCTAGRLGSILLTLLSPTADYGWYQSMEL